MVLERHQRDRALQHHPLLPYGRQRRLAGNLADVPLREDMTMRTLLQVARTLLAAFAFAAPVAFALPFNADYRVSSLAGSSQNPRLAGEIGPASPHLLWLEQTRDPPTA